MYELLFSTSVKKWKGIRMEENYEVGMSPSFRIILRSQNNAESVKNARAA
jgi:hypothetical protein